jgi:hypothetical protein
MQKQVGIIYWLFINMLKLSLKVERCWNVIKVLRWRLRKNTIDTYLIKTNSVACLTRHFRSQIDLQMQNRRFANALSKLQTRYRNAQSSNSSTHPLTLGLLGRSCAYLFFNAIVRFIRRKIKCCYLSASDSVQDDDTLNSLRFRLACHDDMNRTKPYEINILALSVYNA